VEDRSRRRARLVLIVGILIAILAGAGTFVLSSGSKNEAPAPVATTDVLVAARDLPARSALTAADIKVEKYPADIAPPTALTKPEDVVGKIVQQSLAQGEPILPGKFAAAGAIAFTVFPPNAQPGARATIRAVGPAGIVATAQIKIRGKGGCNNQHGHKHHGDGNGINDCGGNQGD